MTQLKENVIYLESQDEPERIQDLRPDEARVLDIVNREVASAPSLDEIMNYLFDSTSDICPCDRLGLAFVEDDGQRIKAWYAKARYEPVYLKKGYQEDLSATSLKRVIESRRVRIIRDLERYAEERPESSSTRLLLREGVRSNMTCPLSIDGRNIGVLFRSSRQADVYDDRQARLHMYVARRLSQAVEKAYRIEQLSAANKAYFEMLAFVTHELKNPVASLVTDATILLDGYLGEMNDQQRQRIERIIRKGQYLLGLTREYLDLAKIEGGDLELRPTKDVDIMKELIQPVYEIFRSQAEEKEMRLRLAPFDSFTADCDVDLLRIALSNLVGNAIKYGSTGGQIEIRAERAPSSFQISVWNEGVGFRPSDKRRLFQKFSRLNNPELKKERGTGVGLYNTWRIIGLHGGRIWADSESGYWAEFAMRIPQPLPQES